MRIKPEEAARAAAKKKGITPPASRKPLSDAVLEKAPEVTRVHKGTSVDSRQRVTLRVASSGDVVEADVQDECGCE